MGEKGYKEILQELEVGILANPLIFYGEEDFLIRWAIDKIIERFVGKDLASLNLTALEWQDADIDELCSLLETLPMMAEKRLLVLENFSFDSKDPRLEHLMTEIDKIPGHSLMIICSSAVDKRTRLYKKQAAKGGIYCFDRLNEAELRSFIFKRLKQAGKSAHSSVIRNMIEESGYLDRQSNYSLYNFENDIKKLIALSEDNIITAELVEAGLTKNTEAYVFDMIDAISSGEKGEAIHLLHSLLKGGSAWQQLLSLIVSTYELILICKEMAEDGYRQAGIVKDTGIHEYRVKKALALSRRYTKKQLRNNLSLCINVDREIKTGLLDSELAMELLIANI